MVVWPGALCSRNWGCLLFRGSATTACGRRRRGGGVQVRCTTECVRYENQNKTSSVVSVEQEIENLFTSIRSSSCRGYAIPIASDDSVCLVYALDAVRVHVRRR
jgi:hypothetical protein